MVVLTVHFERVRFLRNVAVMLFVVVRLADFFVGRVYSISSPFLKNKEYY